MHKTYEFYIRQISAILVLLGILATIIFLSRGVNILPFNDYLEYWTAGSINLTGGNPYSSNEMFALQQQLGWKESNPLMMWNPPWLLALAMPFSMIDYQISRMFWFLLELLTLFFSADMLWQIYRADPKQRWIAWIAVLAFGPTLHTLKMGQISCFILLGSVGFLYFLQKGKLFWAGIFASLILLKPHLLYLLVFAILFWTWRTRSWKLLTGIAVGIILPFVISSLPNTHLISQYLHAIQSNPPTVWKTATLGMVLRSFFGADLFYLQFLPSILGFIWLLIYWMRNQYKWNWSTDLPLIIVVSTATTAYGWAFDVSVTAFAIVHIAAIFNFEKWTIRSISIFITFWIVSLLNAFLSKPQPWFWWLGSFYLAWYVVSHHLLIGRQQAAVIER